MSSLLLTLRSKNIDLGVHYIHGDVINIAHGINRDKEYNTPELEIGQATTSIFSQYVCLLSFSNHSNYSFVS